MVTSKQLSRRVPCSKARLMAIGRLEWRSFLGPLAFKSSFQWEGNVLDVVSAVGKFQTFDNLNDHSNKLHVNLWSSSVAAEFWQDEDLTWLQPKLTDALRQTHPLRHWRSSLMARPSLFGPWYFVFPFLRGMHSHLLSISPLRLLSCLPPPFSLSSTLSLSLWLPPSLPPLSFSSLPPYPLMLHILNWLVPYLMNSSDRSLTAFTLTCYGLFIDSAHREWSGWSRE